MGPTVSEILFTKKLVFQQHKVLVAATPVTRRKILFEYLII